MKRYCILLFIILSFSSLCKGQEKTWLAGVGHAAILDTYLSQEHYSGIELNLLHEMTKPLKKDSLWSRTHTYQLEFSRTQPRSGVATDYTGMFDYSFGMHRMFTIAHKVNIAVGGQVDFFVGGIYNTRNGNNPAQAKLGVDVAPTVRADYSFHIKRQRMRLNYCIDLPLVGLQFSPAYGQSYYEIFATGNYDHNVCFYSPFSGVSLAHRLTLNIFFRNKALTVGYLGNCRQSEFNNLKYHSYSHSFIIGVTL